MSTYVMCTLSEELVSGYIRQSHRKYSREYHTHQPSHRPRPRSALKDLYPPLIQIRIHEPDKRQAHPKVYRPTTHRRKMWHHAPAEVSPQDLEPKWISRACLLEVSIKSGEEEVPPVRGLAADDSNVDVSKRRCLLDIALPSRDSEVNGVYDRRCSWKFPG